LYLFVKLGAFPNNSLLVWFQGIHILRLKETGRTHHLGLKHFALEAAKRERRGGWLGQRLASDTHEGRSYPKRRSSCVPTLNHRFRPKHLVIAVAIVTEHLVMRWSYGPGDGRVGCRNWEFSHGEVPAAESDLIIGVHCFPFFFLQASQPSWTTSTDLFLSGHRH
jgi:hypothetical protein